MQPSLVFRVSFCSVLGAEFWDDPSPDMLSSTFPVIPVQRKEKENYIKRRVVATHKSTHNLDRNKLPTRWLPYYFCMIL